MKDWISFFPNIYIYIYIYNNYYFQWVWSTQYAPQFTCYTCWHLSRNKNNGHIIITIIIKEKMFSPWKEYSWCQGRDWILYPVVLGQPVYVSSIVQKRNQLAKTKQKKPPNCTTKDLTTWMLSLLFSTITLLLISNNFIQ